VEEAQTGLPSSSSLSVESAVTRVTAELKEETAASAKPHMQFPYGADAPHLSRFFLPPTTWTWVSALRYP